MSCAGGPDLIQDGLVLHLDAADRKSYPGSGTIWTDRSGFGNNGTLTNGPTFSTVNGGNIVFDGTNDYVILNDSSSLDVDYITISCCLYPKEVRSAEIISKYNSISPNIPYGFQIWGDSKFYFHINTSTGWLEVSPFSYVVNNWYYVTMTYDGTNFIIYLNGSEKLKTLKSGTINKNNVPLYIALNGGFIGNIFQTSIYNRALSAAEIKQNYNSQKSRFNLR